MILYRWLWLAFAVVALAVAAFTFRYQNVGHGYVPDRWTAEIEFGSRRCEEWVGRYPDARCVRWNR